MLSLPLLISWQSLYKELFPSFSTPSATVTMDSTTRAPTAKQPGAGIQMGEAALSQSFLLVVDQSISADLCTGWLSATESEAYSRRWRFQGDHPSWAVSLLLEFLTLRTVGLFPWTRRMFLLLWWVSFHRSGWAVLKLMAYRMLQGQVVYIDWLTLCWHVYRVAASASQTLSVRNSSHVFRLLFIHTWYPRLPVRDCRGLLLLRGKSDHIWHTCTLHW